MIVVAIAVAGAEYLYSPKTAHKVNAQKAQKIVALLNAAKYGINDDAHTWHAYEVDRYDDAFVWAEDQEFRLGKTLTRRACCPFRKL